MSIDKLPKEKCTGCLVCKASCPKKCIQVIINNEGFSYPAINKNQCINCSLCEKKCPALTQSSKSDIKKAYALQIKSSLDLKNSASGGVAFLVGKKVIKKGGVCYGAIYDNELNVIHSRASNIEELKKQQGSKYVQSDIYQSFSKIKEDCKNGKPVLFIGTPCQVAAVKNYIGNQNKCLYTIDLICHGVPSSKLFKNYIKWKLKKLKSKKMINYKFRDKTKGWGTNYKAIADKKAKFGFAMEDPYYSDFILAKNYRLSCYECDYAYKERVGDMTIGDYWGINKHVKTLPFDESEGVSCVLVNTEKGKELLESIKSESEMVETTIDNAIESNSNLRFPAKKPSERKQYYKKIYENGFEWEYINLFKRISFYKSIIKRCIPSKIKKTIKKIRRK